MTRRDQTLRAWIERESSAHCWQSMVSHKRKVHRKTTGTRIRKAALEFNRSHITHVLTGKPATTSPAPVQPNLFP